MSADLFWDNLILLIASRRVVPVIGRDLFLLPENADGERLTIYQELARRLAAKYEIEMRPGARLEHIVSECQRKHRSKAGSYAPFLYHTLQELQRVAPVPAGLQNLAAIRDFDLFVTTALDPWMEKALEQSPARRGIPVHPYAYSRRSAIDDIPTTKFDERLSHVYHLFGRCSHIPDYAMNEGDVVEHCFDLQGGRRPKMLFDRLKGSHLLVIGCRFPDWLGRFFIRLVKNNPIDDDSLQQFLALERFQELDEFVYFISANESHHVVVQDGIEGFTEELVSRWRAERGAEFPEFEEAEVTGTALPGVARGEVFISYAREDEAVAKQLMEALEARGVSTWHDSKDLPFGTQWRDRIQRALAKSSMFIPIVSNTTRRRLEVSKASSPPFFAAEWNLAKQRGMRYLPPMRYFWPLLLDGMSPDADHIPLEFGAANAAVITNGRVPEAFLDQVAAYYEEIGP